MPGALRCPLGHSFDLAKQGYVSLLGRSASAVAGDTAEMVGARHEFLSAGHYDALSTALVMATAQTPPGPVLDLGAGTGYHLAALLDADPDRVGVALDRSRYAARRAAHAHPRAGAIIADTWLAIPVQSGSIASAICVFSPRNGPEIARVLSPEGDLTVVTPGPDHLSELVSALGLLSVDERKSERLANTLQPYLDLVDSVEHRWTLELSLAAVEAAATMGPTAHHLDPAELKRRVRTLSQPVRTTACINISRYQHHHR